MPRSSAKRTANRKAAASLPRTSRRARAAKSTPARDQVTQERQRLASPAPEQLLSTTTRRVGATSPTAPVAAKVPERFERLWYGKLRLAPIEAIVALLPLGVPDAPRRIHARVADTNTVLNELVAMVRRREEIAFVTTIREGGLRLHVASSIPDEIEEKIAERSARGRVDPDGVRARWREEVRPRLRLVDVGEPDLTELAAVAARDRDDLPTAQLSAILGPGSTWSGDKDLIDPGLAEPYVLELVVAIREVCVIDVKVMTTAEQMTIVTRLGSELVRAIGRLDMRGRVLVGGLALGVVIGGAVLLRRKPELRQGVLDLLTDIGEAITKEVTEGYALREAWSDRLPAPLAIETARADRAIARVLAAAPAPLTADEIRQLLGARQFDLGVDAIDLELGKHPMFVSPRRGLWQLGRADPVWQ